MYLTSIVIDPLPQLQLGQTEGYIQVTESHIWENTHLDLFKVGTPQLLLVLILMDDKINLDSVKTPAVSVCLISHWWRTSLSLLST